MRYRRVSFIGNCQSNALANFYRDFVGSAREEEVHSIDDLGMDDNAIRAAVADADVVVVQERDFKRGLTREELGGNKEVYTFPLIMAGFLWPFANEPHVQNVSERPISDGPYPSQMGDSYLNRLIRKGVSPEEALRQYRDLDIARTASLDRMCEIYLDRQRQRDQATGFDLADFIAERFRQDKLFLTAEHPDTPLFVRTAGQLLAAMNIPVSISEAALATVFRTPFPPTELPLHPGVIAHFGLAHADPGGRYMFHDEGGITFDEFVLRYMRYESNGDLRRAIYMVGRQPADQTIADLTTALERSPESPRGSIEKGRLLRKIGRLHEACAALRIAVSNAPSDPDPVIELGHVFLQKGNAEAAGIAARSALDLAPLYSEALALHAQVLITSGDLQGAADAGNRALQLNPASGHIGRLLGIAFAAAGKWEHAEHFAREAVRIEPSRADPTNLLAEILEQQQRRPEAIAMLDLLVERDQANDQTFSLLGNLRLRDGALEQAEQAFDKGARLHGDSRPDLKDCLLQVREMRRAAA